MRCLLPCLPLPCLPCRLGLDSGMQHAGMQLGANASILADELPPGVTGPQRALRAPPCSDPPQLDLWVPTLGGVPRAEALALVGSAFQPTGGQWDSCQHDPESASYAGGESAKIHLCEPGAGGCMGSSRGAAGV